MRKWYRRISKGWLIRVGKCLNRGDQEAAKNLAERAPWAAGFPFKYLICLNYRERREERPSVLVPLAEDPGKHCGKTVKKSTILLDDVSLSLGI